ncbi:hypothetical protein DICPUDRAFT_156281 [Dictyostelium purpureum]|uniref:RCC1-like domain-containing protein n=1 Tax=Dictyostelium purpureum TaxID=5786 RepID=F0ZW67_DICPU|nr:uncharacterized protein DICPUDRAFT_156281 [Dictyostelium purpureum]EGC31817.1 hypothetical protein DICPUDRAFT_156281 [Dictyostelium purpureum]|eukprot:XP_003291651.1 hypothetical protein DICPUDRAFT_156281 [Dictyostelium purpureum]
MKSFKYLSQNGFLIKPIVQTISIKPIISKQNIIQFLNINKRNYTTNKYLYSCGCGIDGKLGIDNELVKFESFPTKLTKFDNGENNGASQRYQDNLECKDIVCGHYHTMLVSKEKDQLYSCGWTSFVAMDRVNKETNFKSIIPSLVTPLKDFKIKQVAGGRRHTLVLTEDFRVFSFGVGSEYQLGVGSTENQPLPVEIESLSKLGNIIKLECGWGHSLVLTSDGDIFTWGFTQDSQTGHGFSEEPIHIPKMIKTNYKFKNIFTGSDFNLAITNDGRVCSWGSGEFGQLGHGDTKNVEAPKLIQSIQPLVHTNLINTNRIYEYKMVACGFSHALIIDNDGKLLTLGWNGNGQLGSGVKGDNHLVPTKLEFDFDGEKVVKVSAGRNHSACITESGKLYIWGNGNKGKLGNGKSVGDQLTPLELIDIDENNTDPSNQKVLNISCGFDHTIIELLLNE